MLPVKDESGQLFGYLGRKIPHSSDSSSENQNDPKYLFPKNLPKSRFLFGAWELGTFGPAPLKRIYLVESPFCVMKFASLGLPAVAVYGWSVSPEQIRLLSELARGIVYLPDQNKHQQAESCLANIAQVLWLRFPSLPDQIQDPEELSYEAILALTH
jgi:DNA primase